MKIQWLGTAGFRIKFNTTQVLVDPYLTRNPDARPEQPLGPEDLGPVSHIFISHGHFDHLKDVPAIAAQTGARVYCSPEAGQTLEKLGLDRGRVKRIFTDGWEEGFSDFTAQAFFSQHVRFDIRLLLTTLAKINVKIPQYLPLIREFPCGQVLSWQFQAENKRLHFFGSAGATPEELDRLKGLIRDPLDILLVPLQGHTHICDIAARYVKILEPKRVIPHHQDDFFPPISQQVDIAPFVKRVTKECPATQIHIMKLNQTLVL